MRRQLSVLILLCLAIPAMAQFRGSKVRSEFGEDAYKIVYRPNRNLFWTGLGQVAAGASLATYSYYCDYSTFNGETVTDLGSKVKFARLHEYPLTGEIFGAVTAAVGVYDVIASISGMRRAGSSVPVVDPAALKKNKFIDAGMMVAGAGAAVGGMFWLRKHNTWNEVIRPDGQVIETGDRNWALPMATIAVGSALLNYGLGRFIVDSSKPKGPSKLALQTTPAGIAIVF